MSMYEQFKTNADLETQGITLDYGDFKIKVARAGGSNKKYLKTLKAMGKPYERAANLGLLDPDIDFSIMTKVYAESVIKDWQVEVEGKFKRGIEGPNGDILAFNKKNVAEALHALPELYSDIVRQVSNMELFKESILETESKN